MGTWTVGAGAADFNLSAVAPQMGQAGGAAAMCPETVSVANGFGGPVTLSLADSPAGVTASYSANPRECAWDDERYAVGSGGYGNGNIYFASCGDGRRVEP